LTVARGEYDGPRTTDNDTSAEYPIIASAARTGVRTITDIDVLAFRFPRGLPLANPRKRPPQGLNVSDIVTIATDNGERTTGTTIASFTSCCSVASRRCRAAPPARRDTAANALRPWAQKVARLIRPFPHQLVHLIVEATNRRLDFGYMRGREMPVVVQHVENHVAGEQHVGEFVDNTLLQRKMSLDVFRKNFFAWKGNLFDCFDQFVTHPA